MKLFSWLKSTVLVTAIIPAPCAWAQFQGQWNFPVVPTNAPPTVQIITPQEGSVFLLGSSFDLCADANYFTNPIASVDFFAGTNSLGVVSNSVERSRTFCLTVSGLAAGNYKLTAVATDTGGISATSAVVDISVVSSFPPKIRLVEPENGAVILGPTNIDVCAAAYDPDGTVVSVEFFEGTNSLGVVPAPVTFYVTNRFGIFPIREPFCLTWSNAPAGAYTLTAVATSNDGLTATSAPVNLTVVTALPPKVRIEVPQDGSAYYAPAKVSIIAAASDPYGTLASVAFYAGSNSLGVVTVPVVVTNLFLVEDLYSLTWSNVPAGDYALTAVATDTAGLSSTSVPVNIHVLSPPPPKVSITSPLKGQIFLNAPLNIEISAFERYFTNPVAQVQFFAGANSVGVTTNAPYSSIVWSNVPPGAYTLEAVATDQASLSVTSAPVSITVVSNRPSGFNGGR